MRGQLLATRRRTWWLAGLVCVSVLLAAPPAMADPPQVARGLELVGSTDYGLSPTRNTEIELRGNHVYVGSHEPFDAMGRSRGLKVADVSNPESPALATNFPLPGRLMDVQVNNDIDRCGYGKDLAGVNDPACNTVLGTTQTAADDGIWLFDIRHPANAQPWAWDDTKAYADQTAFVAFPPSGSHNGFLFGDYAFVGGISRNTFEIWDISPLFEDPAQPPVRVAFYDNRNDPRPIRPQSDARGSHDLFVQRVGDRVFTYVPGTHFYIVDVTDVVDGTTTGDISDHLVGYNNYVDADGTVTMTPTVNTFSHYAEPTDDGDHTYVGDETIWCGDPGIIHILDTADLPQVGETPARLPEVGLITWPSANATICGHTGDTQHVRRLGTSGHNFRIYGDVLTQSAYAAGVMVWDISNRTDPALLAHFKATSNHGGKARETKEGAWFTMPPFVWQVVADGDPAALLRGEQYMYASDVVSGLYVLRMRPLGAP
jgi:hypothetical protein